MSGKKEKRKRKRLLASNKSPLLQYIYLHLFEPPLKKNEWEEKINEWIVIWGILEDNFFVMKNYKVCFYEFYTVSFFFFNFKRRKVISSFSWNIDSNFRQIKTGLCLMFWRSDGGSIRLFWCLEIYITLCSIDESNSTSVSVRKEGRNIDPIHYFQLY